MRQGAARHAIADRKDDLYETPPEATRALLRAVDLPAVVWECAAGRGAIAREILATGRGVIKTELVAYAGADPGITTGVDFLMETQRLADTIVTNPPYKLADQFIRHGLALGCTFYALLRLAALEGAARSDLIDGHLTDVWVGIERLPFMHREGWQGPKNGNSGAPFAWFKFQPIKPPGPVAMRRISWRSTDPDRAPLQESAA